jgi:translation initiation factor IF-2
MGHIDHGKSSLLDFIRKANVTAGEAGGITQHVSAYVASHDYEGETREITFLDTPGHEAFRALRSRGAQAADIAILVVAADEGVKPQTKEAYDAIIEAHIPHVVAFTKTDKNGADIERAKASVLEAGIYLEGLGGSVPYTPVSSKTGEGVPELLDLVLLTADISQFTADDEAPPQGFVLESSQDAKRGASATLIVKNGTLTTGTFSVAGSALAPVRFIEDFRGKRVERVGPSLPAVISGWSELPSPGVTFFSYKTKKEAEKAVAEMVQQAPSITHNAGKEEGAKTVLPVVLRADVAGSIEAIRHELRKVTHERALLRVVAAQVGAVTETDIKTAHAIGGVVVAFHTSVEATAADLALRLSVPIESFDIIYDLEKRLQELLNSRAPRMKKEEALGEAKILKLFNTSGTKQVMGGELLSGTLMVGNQVKITRRDIELGYGKITNLQQARMDVKALTLEGEFGMQIESKVDIGQGDRITAFKVVEI